MRIRCLFVLASLSAAQAAAQVELPPGFEIVDFHVSDDYTQRPSLNNCGQIAYGKRFGSSWAQSEIFLYENGRITRITENEGRDVIPDINDHGQMVWLRGPDSEGVYQVILFEKGSETIIDDHSKGVLRASINNLGHIAWTRVRSRSCPLKQWVYLYVDQKITRISQRLTYVDQACDINDAGWITWMHSDFCESNPWSGTIQLYRDGQVIDLPSEQTQVQESRVNNAGQVVWSADTDIEFWEDGKTQVLVRDLASVPNIGDAGDIYFAYWDIARGTWNAWMCRFENLSPRFYRLSDDAYSAARGSVNCWGEMAWVFYGDPPRSDWSGGIRFMRRIRNGDANFDGAVDLKDYSDMASAMSGPQWTEGLCESRFLDINYDGDVDLADFARLQTVFGE